MGGLPFHRYGAETAWPVRSSTGYRTRAGWLLASATIYLGWLFGTGGRLLCGQEAGADLVVIHAVIRTQSPDKPVAEALAVRGNRVAEVGSNESIRTWIKPRTHVIDARGRLVVPGFNDSHVHFLAGGQQLSSVDLRTARTTDELAARLRTFAATWPKGRWITGGDWDHENWPGAPLPTRQMIDAASPDHPVFVSRLDGHMALANSVALQRGQVTRDTPDPPGGVIVRDPATGEPTGVLKDAAMQLVSSRIPPLSFDEKLQAAQAATEHAARLGVTSVQDMSGGTDILVYRELHRRQKLRTRVYAMLPLARWDEAQGRGLRAASGDAWLREGGLKGFADGSLGSTTALFFEPYLDAPATRGIPSDEMIPEEKMWQRMVAADHAGLQLMIHAIGDRANDQILAFYERLSREEPSRDRRGRIEHAQHLRRDDIRRFGAAGVVASMQPYHCADDGRWAEKRIGPERSRGTYAFRSLIDSGARLAVGSDWNVAPLDPLQGIAAAVTRRTLDGRHPDGWVPQEKISVDEAVRAYTVGSAYAEFTESEKGQLIPGMLADFVLLSRDIFTEPPDLIASTKVLVTVVDGRVVHAAE